MHKSTIMGLIGLAGFGALMAPYAAAQERPYFYGGLSAGQSQSQMDEQATVKATVNKYLHNDDHLAGGSRYSFFGRLEADF